MKLFDIELAYQNLRQSLKRAASGNLKIKSISEFLGLILPDKINPNLESYLYEIQPVLFELIRKNDFEFVSPEYIELLKFRINKMKEYPVFEKMNKEFDEINSYLTEKTESLIKKIHRFESRSLKKRDSIASVLIENFGLNNGAASVSVHYLNLSAVKKPHSNVTDKIEFVNYTETNDESLKNELKKNVKTAKTGFVKGRINEAGYDFTFWFDDKNYYYTGSSLGINSACLAFNAILINELSPYYYRFDQNTVFTGETDENGNSIAMDPEILKEKLNGVYFSGYDKFVIPKDNFNECFFELNKLMEKYPGKKLLLIPVEHYSEVFDNPVITERYYLKFSEKLNLYYRKFQKTINAAAVIVIAAAIVYSLYGIILPGLDKSPVSFEYKGRKYHLFNQYGKKIWESEMMTTESDNLINAKELSYKTSLLVDLDDNKENEFYYTHIVQDNHEKTNSIFNYRNDSLKVFFTLPLKNIYTLGNRDTMLSTIAILYFNTIESQLPGKKNILFQGSHRMWFPSVVGVIDHEGKPVSEFWNYGALRMYAQFDIDGDGSNELFLGGTYNKDNRATFVVFDKDYIDGSSPEFDISGRNRPGLERHYIELPRSLILEKSKKVRNDVNMITLIGDTLFAVHSTEYDELDPSTGYRYIAILIYIFDFKMNCLEINTEDRYNKIYSLERQKDPSLPDIRTYCDSLKNHVRWWDGEKYVNYAAENGEYLKVRN